MTVTSYLPRFIGNATLGAAATDIGPVAIPAGYGLIIVSFYIAGYSATQIAGIRLGATAAVDTAANYSHFSNNFTTTATAGTSTVSADRVQVAQAAQTGGRRGNAVIQNASGQNKIVTVNTLCYGAAAPTAATAMTANSLVVGSWFNTAQALSVSLNSGGAGTLNIGSYISVYGVPGTG